MNVQTPQPTGSRERSLEEVKAKFMRRAGRLSPFEDIRREDAERVVGALTSLDSDHWARQWSEDRARLRGQGRRARGRRRARPRSSPSSTCSPSTHCRVGRYPVPSSPGKLAAYEHSLRMFRKAAKHFEPPLKIVELPFEGKTLVGYLQLPPGVARPPVVMHWGGVDGWKEDRLRAADSMHGAPGSPRSPSTCPAPARARCSIAIPPPSAPTSAWLDYLPQRGDVDGSRVAVWGGSFGAYWAARLAYVEAKRIKGAVFHGGNVHYGFQANGWCRPSPPAAPPICSAPASLLEARGRAMGTKTMEEFLAAAPSFSLQDHGPPRPAVGADPRRQRQARRPGAGRRHLSPDGARQPEGGAHLSRGPPHGAHARPAVGAHHARPSSIG